MDKQIRINSEIQELHIEDVCVQIVSGGTPNASREEYYGGEIPWLRTQEVDFC